MAKIEVILVIVLSWFAISYARARNFRSVPPEAKLNTVSVLFDLPRLSHNGFSRFVSVFREAIRISV